MGITNSLIGAILAIVGLALFMGGFLLSKRSSVKQSVLTSAKYEKEKKELQELNNRFAGELSMLEETLQSIQEGTILTNLEGIIIWTNRKALEILKTSRSISVGKNINQILPPNKKLVTLDGETINLNVKIDTLKNNNLEIKGKIYVIADVTQNFVLEQMKLDFVAIAAHQLRTPLTAIKGYLSLLTESAPPKLDQDENTFLQRSIISANRLGSLIENLLNVSRIEKGALKISLRPINLEDVVKLTVDVLLENARQKNIQLLLGNLVPPYPKVLGDPSLLGEAISNIISNGIKYNHPGGQVMVILAKQADGVTIHVSDNGKGIPANTLPHLFQRFYRATSSLSDLSNGIGLGLYISKSIIDAHKGKIWINSLEGQGTTVSIFIPKAPDQTIQSSNAIPL